MRIKLIGGNDTLKLIKFIPKERLIFLCETYQTLKEINLFDRYNIDLFDFPFQIAKKIEKSLSSLKKLQWLRGRDVKDIITLINKRLDSSKSNKVFIKEQHEKLKSGLSKNFPLDVFIYAIIHHMKSTRKKFRYLLIQNFLIEEEHIFLDNVEKYSVDAIKKRYLRVKKNLGKIARRYDFYRDKIAKSIELRVNDKKLQTRYILPSWESLLSPEADPCFIEVWKKRRPTKIKKEKPLSEEDQKILSALTQLTL